MRRFFISKIRDWTGTKLGYVCAMPSPVDIVIEFLKAQESRGLSHLALDDNARLFLNHLVKNREGKNGVAAQKISAHAGRVAEKQLSPVVVSTAAPLPSLHISGVTKAELLADLKRQLVDWPSACGIATLRPTLVFSSGNADAKIMIVGESPSHADESAAHPFSGPSGDKFDSILKAMNLSRQDVYMTYLVKFRPSMPRQTTNNRMPDAAEIAAFLPVLQKECKIVQPAVILALGSVAARVLCSENFDLQSSRGQWHEWQGLPLRTSESPSLLLTASNVKKREVWEDMLAVMERVGMPCDEKQRGYFLTK
jgi:uracil-DNA glycosylase family 4